MMRKLVFLLSGFLCCMGNIQAQPIEYPVGFGTGPENGLRAQTSKSPQAEIVSGRINSEYNGSLAFDLNLFTLSNHNGVGYPIILRL